MNQHTCMSAFLFDIMPVRTQSECIVESVVPLEVVGQSQPVYASEFLCQSQLHWRSFLHSHSSYTMPCWRLESVCMYYVYHPRAYRASKHKTPLLRPPLYDGQNLIPQRSPLQRGSTVLFAGSTKCINNIVDEEGGGAILLTVHSMLEMHGSVLFLKIIRAVPLATEEQFQYYVY